MKLRYNIKDISPKNKAFAIADLIHYWAETKYKLVENVEKLNSSETTKGMIANLLRKAMNNPAVGAIFDNMQELSKKEILKFKINDQNPIIWNNDKDCSLYIEMNDEYFSAQAIYAMMRPGFRKMTYEEYVKKEKLEWKRWFDKQLRDYASNFSCNILEE